MGSETPAAKPFTILTAEQFAERIHASAGWVRRNAESLGGVKVARKWLFSEATIAGWFEGRMPTIGPELSASSGRRPGGRLAKRLEQERERLRHQRRQERETSKA